MNYIKISKDDIANGIGIRTVLWVSGCDHNCYNCHNPQTHSFCNGQVFNDKTKELLYSYIAKPYVKGVTFSGGDPLYPSNREDVEWLSYSIRNLFPYKDQWLYTGYTWEEIISDTDLLESIENIDVLVDGRYIDELRDITLPFRGSSNQRIIDVPKSLESGKVVLWSAE